MSGTQLTVRGLAAGYHGFQVIQGLDLDVTPGVTVVLGPNGAGKTTLLKAQAVASADGSAAPSSTASPVRGSSPASALSSVVLPAPLGPSTT